MENPVSFAHLDELFQPAVGGTARYEGMSENNEHCPSQNDPGHSSERVREDVDGVHEGSRKIR